MNIERMSSGREGGLAEDILRDLDEKYSGDVSDMSVFDRMVYHVAKRNRLNGRRFGVGEEVWGQTGVLPDGRRERRIAGDATAVVDDDGLPVLMKRDGESEYGDIEEGLDPLLYVGDIEQMVDNQLGTYVLRLPLDSQKNLLRYMTSIKDEDGFERLKIAIHERFETLESRERFLKAFLALDFGEDFGEVLLADAEGTPPEVFEKILGSIDRIRGEAREFGEVFEGFDGGMGAAVTRAIGERVTEILYTLRKLNDENGEPLGARVNRQKVMVNGYEDIVNSLGWIEGALTKINDGLSSNRAEKVYENGEVNGWYLGDDGEVLMVSNASGVAQGTFDRNVLYGDEGTLNFLTRIGGGSTNVMRSERDSRDFSIRFDLEGAILDANGGHVGFDATRSELPVAVDIGGVKHGKVDNPNHVVGGVIAIGNKLRKSAQKERSLGYHTQLGVWDKEKFRAMVDYFQEMAAAKARRLQARRLGQQTLRHISEQPETTAA